MGDARTGSRDGEGVPWSALLDPVANARALAEVQAQGLRAAGELVERIIGSLGDGARPGWTAPGRVGEGPSDAPRSIGGLVEVWIDLLRRTSESVARLADDAAGGDGSRASVGIDLDSGRATGAVLLHVDNLGAATGESAEVWLHNGTATSLGPVTLRAGQLMTADDQALAACVRFEPATIDDLPPRSSRGVGVAIVASGDLTAGTYRGLVQAGGAPQVWLPLEVVVDGSPP